MNNNIPAWGVVLAACVPLLATAQGTKTEPPKPTAQLTFQSAFADYKPYKDAPPDNWRVLNDAVAGGPGGANGHAGHGMGGTKGTEMPATPAASASAPMPMKPMRMHHGHPQKGGKP